METDIGTKRTQLAEYLGGMFFASPEIKKAFLDVRRENFLPQNMRNLAYEDGALPIWDGQTLSQPSTIAIMLQILGLKEGMKVLEVGSGSGYMLALMSKIVGPQGKVYGAEISEQLFEKSKELLSNEGIQNFEIKNGDGAQGWTEKSPFDRIIMSCACPFIPKKLFDQLIEGGRVLGPVGYPSEQLLEMIIKHGGKPVKKTLSTQTFVFVPMKGKDGFK